MGRLVGWSIGRLVGWSIGRLVTGSHGALAESGGGSAASRGRANGGKDLGRGGAQSSPAPRGPGVALAPPLVLQAFQQVEGTGLWWGWLGWSEGYPLQHHCPHYPDYPYYLPIPRVTGKVGRPVHTAVQ